MEALLDAADALVNAWGDSPPRPDFPFPDGLPTSPAQIQKLLDLRDSPKKGKGWFAKTKIPAGTVLMAAKPLAMAMDWQDDGGSEAEQEGDDEDLDQHAEPYLNSILFLQLLKDIQKSPSIWTETLAELFPRNERDLEELPVLVVGDSQISQQRQALLQELRNISELKAHIDHIAKRLPQIIRYNVLSAETCPELLSHSGPGGHSSLGGAALYHWPSFFNHNSRPNVARWAVGDVMWFVANQDIDAGSEACISYIEHDILCESASRRNAMLQMDFDEEDLDETEGAEEDDDGPDLPVVDIEVQNEIMGMPAFERLGAIDELLLQAQGLSNPEDSDAMEDNDADAMETSGSGWFQCDIQNLRILKAIALEGLGQSNTASDLWTECADFAETKLPPLDENSVVMHVQAALCLFHLGKVEQAKLHAQKALYIHDKIFGGGAGLLRRRYRQDLKLSFRPKSKQNSTAIDTLWPL